MRFVTLFAFAGLSAACLAGEPPYLYAYSALYGVGGVSQESQNSTGTPVSASRTSAFSTARSTSSWGRASVVAEGTSPNSPAYNSNQVQVITAAEYRDLLTIKNAALDGQSGFVTYQVRVKGSVISEGGFNVQQGRVGENSNKAWISLNYGEMAHQTYLYDYRAYGDGTSAGVDFTNQTLTIKESFNFNQPMHIRL